MTRGELVLRATFSVILLGLCASGLTLAIYAPPSVSFSEQFALGAVFVLLGVLTQAAAWADL